MGGMEIAWIGALLILGGGADPDPSTGAGLPLLDRLTILQIGEHPLSQQWYREKERSGQEAPWTESGAPLAPAAESEGPSLEFSPGIQAVSVWGTATSDDNFNELWGGGTGYHLHGLVHLYARRTPRREISFGLGFLFDRAVYGGETSWGTKADDLTISKFLLGGHFRACFGNFFLATQIGGGWAWFGDTDVTSEMDGRFKLYNATSTSGWEFLIRLGGKWSASDDVQLSLFCFFGGGGTGEPNVASQAISVLDEVSTSSTHSFIYRCWNLHRD